MLTQIYSLMASNNEDAKSGDARRMEVASSIDLPMRLILPYQPMCWSMMLVCILHSGRWRMEKPNASFGWGKIIMKDSFKIGDAIDSIGLEVSEEPLVADRNWVTDVFVAMESFAVHRVTNWQSEINVIIYADFFLTLIFAVKATDVLGNESFPWYW